MTPSEAAGAWAEGINHLAVLALPQAVVRASGRDATGATFGDHVIAAVERIQRATELLPALPGAGPEFTKMLNDLLALLRERGPAVAEVTQLARRIVERTGSVRREDWTELEKKVLAESEQGGGSAR